MKKFILGIAAIATTFSAFAEGYQVNTLSARQNGMGHTGTALKLGSESMIFNPAGLGFLDKTLDVKASVSGIFATATATVGQEEFKTDNSPSTPLSVNLGFRIYDNFSAGISFYTPYGSNINWGEHWAGAVLNQSVKLSVYTIQPTFAFRPIKNLSIGAGLMVSWGSVDLNKGLVPSETFNLLMPTWISNYGKYTTPASVNLNGSSKVAVGVNLGVMYDINSRWTVGFNYRSKMNMKVSSGAAALSFANDDSRKILESSLKLIDKANFKAEMPCVSILNFGVSYKPLENLTLAADAQLSLWNEYKQLDIEFLDPALAGYNQNIEKNYHNTWTWHLGAEWNLTKRFDLRAGLMVDTAPMSKHNYNPETPGMTKIEPSVGFSFRPVPSFSIDFGFLYVAGLGVDNASVQYNDMLAGTINSMMGQEVVKPVKTFTADYKVHAFIPSIGISYNF